MSNFLFWSLFNCSVHENNLKAEKDKSVKAILRYILFLI